MRILAAYCIVVGVLLLAMAVLLAIGTEKIMERRAPSQRAVIVTND